MLDLEQYSIGGRTAREIAASVEAAIRAGGLASGSLLPTVRELAGRLGTSPATVSSAYRTLAQRGLVVAEGRRGTRVAPRPALKTAPSAQRGARMPDGDLAGAEAHVRDLATGYPDPTLLPDLRAALDRIDLERRPRMGRLEEPDSELLAIARAWFARDGVAAEDLTVLSGAFDAIERVLRAHLLPGDRVLVEDPAYPAIRDVLLALGLVAVPVAVDDRGMLPDAFAAALARNPAGAIVVPRAQNPFGSALDAVRAGELRGLLRPRPDLLLIEDDHAGLVCGAPHVSLIAPESERWAVIRSVSKFLHPDLRVALMAGDATTIARVEGAQALGPAWVSHILQGAVAALMGDPGFDATVARARTAYSARREAMLAALAAEGVEAHSRSGLNVWARVREEAPAVQALLARGFRVRPGERFRLAAPPGLRITIASLREGDAPEVAAVIAGAERRSPGRGAY